MTRQTETTGSNGLFLDRHDQRDLEDVLLDIEIRFDDLVTAITRQSVTGRRDVTAFRRPKKRNGRPPHNEGAQAVADGLQNVLATAIRHTCETRAVVFMPVGFTHRSNFIGPLQPHEKRIPVGYNESSLLVLISWLRRNIVSFAMTEGCVDWADEIAYWGKRIEKIVDLPPDDEVYVDYDRVRDANRQMVTLSTIEVVGRKLGDMGKGLNGRRLRTLIAKGLLKADGEDPETGTKFYRLGDVLDAHHRHTRRNRAS